MFRPMRLNKYETDGKKALESLEKSEYGVLSVIGDDGYPYGVTVNHVTHDSFIYFHCALSGHKIDAIKNNPKVSFTAVSRYLLHPEEYNTEYASVVVFGKAELIEGDEKIKAMKLLVEKFSPGMDGDCSSSLAHTAVVKITTEHITGKANYSGLI